MTCGFLDQLTSSKNAVLRLDGRDFFLRVIKEKNSTILERDQTLAKKVLKGRNFARITATALHTIQSKHLQITIVQNVWKYCFCFAKTVQKNQLAAIVPEVDSDKRRISDLRRHRSAHGGSCWTARRRSRLLCRKATAWFRAASPLQSSPVQSTGWKHYSVLTDPHLDRRSDSQRIRL